MDREGWLLMFARSYFPGRSGQIFVVPRAGHIITDRRPTYPFMHGTPWDVEARIPLLLHGAPYVKAGEHRADALQQDVAPTIAALIGAVPPPTMTGRVLAEAFDPFRRPRVVVLMVLDGMRTDYFDLYADVLPTFSRFRREGAWFTNARVNYLPTATSAGHATIGTGADPRVHGLTANTIFSRATGKPQPAFAGLDPGELMALTLADVWNLTTDGKAVIVGQGGAIRATAGLVGHGACVPGARRVILASYSGTTAGWETNPKCYSMPDYLQPLNGKVYWEGVGGAWLGHNIAAPLLFQPSSLFQRFEGDALAEVATREPFGADDITDLLLVNIKGPDYVGHAYGPRAPEMREEMIELDRQIARVIEIIDRKAGTGGRLLVLTADHGMPDPPVEGGRHYMDEITARIHDRLDPIEKKVVAYYSDAANSFFYVDAERLTTLGLTQKDVIRMLETEPYIQAAFTEDEVRTAQSRLPPR